MKSPSSLMADSQMSVRSLGYPATFVIFGATGDLAEHKLFPALFGLYRKKLLPSRFKIIAFGRRPFTDDSFRDLIRPAIDEAAVTGDSSENSSVGQFLEKVIYHQGLFEETKPYIALINRLGDIDKELGACSHKTFHLALPPSLYETVLKQLEASALNLSCTDGTGLTRILIEKPLGVDLTSAKKTNDLLAAIFKEDQIFRVDHYLTKNALYNLLTIHCSDPALETVWTAQAIESMNLFLWEKNTVAGRGAFYDKIGALRDVGQNHLLEMLSLLLSEKVPTEAEREKSLYRARALKELQFAEVSKDNSKRAQYEGYLEEKGVAPNSQTETYFHVRFFFKQGVWKGVPIVLQSGKALAKSSVGVEIRFRQPVSVFQTDRVSSLIFHVQPNPGIEIISVVDGKRKKIPYSYQHQQGERSFLADNYELVYLDSLKSDQLRFVSKEEAEASWQFTDRALEALRKTPLLAYPQGVLPEEIGTTEN